MHHAGPGRCGRAPCAGKQNCARAGTPAADADAAHLATAAERALQMLMKLQGAKRGRGCEYVVIR